MKQFLKSIRKFLKSVNNFIPNLLEEHYRVEENLRNFCCKEVKKYDTVGHFGDSKLGYISGIIYDHILLSSEKRPKKEEEICKKYCKIVPWVFELISRHELSRKTFDAEQVTKIIIEILKYKKDELDKVDGGIPIA